MIMFSRSKDSELLASFAEHSGIIPVRGSSSRGGQAALKAMVKYLKQPGNRKAATVVNGPRGPRYRVKKGMIMAAFLAEVPLLPIMVLGPPSPDPEAHLGPDAHPLALQPGDSELGQTPGT
jgi:lysophospholipid acyltransferase (LPLAT)-like uncharacterized protein